MVLILLGSIPDYWDRAHWYVSSNDVARRHGVFFVFELVDIILSSSFFDLRNQADLSSRTDYRQDTCFCRHHEFGFDHFDRRYRSGVSFALC